MINNMISDCIIDSVKIVELCKFADDRGWLMELFRQDSLPEGFNPAMSYMSITKTGMVRGPHEHKEQTDYLIFPGPSNFRLYLWDNRSESPTYGKTFNAEYGENNMAVVIIPPGIVHGYKNIGPVDGITLNAPNRLYRGDGKQNEVDEIRYEDRPDSGFLIE